MDPENKPPLKEDQTRPPRRPKSILLLVFLLMAAALLFWAGQRITGNANTVKVNIPDYLKAKNSGKIKEVWLKGSTLRAKMEHGYAKDGKAYDYITMDVPPAYLESELFNELKSGVESFHYEPESFLLEQLLLTFVPWILIFALIYFFFFRRMGSSGGTGNILNFGKSRAQFVSADKVKTTFADVAGIEEAKEEVAEIVAFLKNPQKFTQLGGRIPRGVLLVGSPGTGKTLLAKAIAGEAGVPFLSISGSDFVEMFVGVGASRVRDLFQKAKESSPCIVFLDEIDAVGRRRGTGLGGGHDEREQTLNQILVSMDGFETDEGIIVIAATNRPDVLDPALLRPGRFDRQVPIDLPDVKGREEILKIHARKIKLGRDVDLKALARATPMFSGADLANVINEAAIIATMRRAEGVAQCDLVEARDKVIFGRQKRSRVMDEGEKKITAYHEAGHALISAKILADFLPLHKVTIIPRGRALGMTMSFPDKDRYHLPKDQCLRQITMCFGGRMAENLYFGQLSAGAADDIKRATDLARRMVCEWGMSDALGPVNYTEEEEHIFLGREITRTRNISEETQKAVDAEIRRIVENAEREAREIISANRPDLERIAEALIKHETLSGDEIRAILDGEDIDAIRAAAASKDASRKETSTPEEDKDKTDPDWKPLPGPQEA